MALTKNDRKIIAQFVTNAREILSDHVHKEMESKFGISSSGHFEDISHLPFLQEKKNVEDYEKLKYSIQLEESKGFDKNQAVGNIILEIVFTLLNRIVAIKVMEVNKVILHSLSKGTKSKGFIFFLAEHPDVEKRFNYGEVDETYFEYLNHLINDISKEIKIVFSNEDIPAKFFPQGRTLNKFLDLINDVSLENVWNDEESLGWIYQYFIPDELRKKIRKESGVPRDCYEMSFRNQFYTPDYVVKYLSENTIGRIWYEMTQGNTNLKNNWEYFIIHPNEYFLDRNEEKEDDDLFLVPFREMKDPRELKILDPACGSGHFLLYAFDLLYQIYIDAYDLALKDENQLKTLLNDYPEKDFYVSQIPKLIIEKNLHGIDIDLRSIQVASLTLFIKAKKYNKNVLIENAHLICAEPLPGDQELLAKITENINPSILRIFLEKVWEIMKSAGEAGSLLQIHEDLKGLVSRAKDEWTKYWEETKGQLNLFDTDQFSEITDDSFWTEAEKIVLNILEKYIKEVQNGQNFKWSVFTQDSKNGFEFINSLNNKYDVVLMNPPFGESTPKTKSYLQSRYPTWNRNLLCAFIERMLELTTENGCVGIIFDRTAIVKSTYESFRKEILINKNSLYSLADLGWEVLDANVETTSIIFNKSYSNQNANNSVFFDVRNSDPLNKGIHLSELISKYNTIEQDSNIYLMNIKDCLKLPNCVIGYDIAGFLRRVFSNCMQMDNNFAHAAQGHAIKMDLFSRYYWELNSLSQIASRQWVLCYNGGSYSYFYLPTKLVIDWRFTGKHLKKHPSTRWSNEKLQFQPGIGYGKRGEYIDAHILLPNHLFTVEGLAIFPEIDKWNLLSLLNSSSVQYILNSYCGQHKHAGYLNLLPIPENIPDIFGNYSKQGFWMKFDWYKGDETNYYFEHPLILQYSNDGNLEENLNSLCCLEDEKNKELKNLSNQLDKEALNLYGITEDKDIAIINQSIKRRPDDVVFLDTRDNTLEQKCSFHIESLISYIIGVYFGRWDYVNGSFLKQDLFKDNDLQSNFIRDLREIILKKDEDLKDKDEIISEPVKYILNDEEIEQAKYINYPFEIDDDGIIPLDDGHAEDLVKKIHDAILKIFGEENFLINLGAIEKYLGSDLRTYLSKKFFPFHTKRYSNRPIYWQFSTKSKEYSLYVYYHKICKDTFYTILRKYVEPKFTLEQKRLNELVTKLSQTDSQKDKINLSKDMEKLGNFVIELKEFKENILEIIDSNIEFDFDDGVSLNIAPFYKLIPLKEAEKTFQELNEGNHEWSTISKKYFKHK